MFLRDAPNGVHITKVAVDMHRHDGRGALGNEPLHLACVQRQIPRAHIGKYRLDPAAHQRVRGGCKRERRSDGLACDAHGADGRLQRQMAVGKQHHMGDVQIGLQGRFQRERLLAVVGEPVVFPQRADLRQVLLKIRHGTACHLDGHGFPLLSGGLGARVSRQGCSRGAMGFGRGFSPAEATLSHAGTALPATSP